MTDAEVKRTIEETTSSLENGWNSVRRSARNLSILYAQGGATCRDVVAYNLTALAIYNTQKAMLEYLRGQGVPGIPAAPPTPTLFSWDGKAAIVECPAQLSANDAATTPLAPGSLKVITSEPNYLDPKITVVDLSSQASGLGLPPTILLIIGGVAFSIGVVIGYSFTKWLIASSFNARVIKEVETRAVTWERFWAARAGCVAECTAKGESQEVCFARCSSLLPEPDLRPTLEDKGWSLWALLGLASAGAVVGALVYRRARRDGGGFVRREVWTGEDEEVEVLPGPTRATVRAKRVAA